MSRYESNRNRINNEYIMGSYPLKKLNIYNTIGKFQISRTHITIIYTGTQHDNIKLPIIFIIKPKLHTDY